MKNPKILIGTLFIWASISSSICLFFLLYFGEDTVFKYESFINNLSVHHTGITLCYHSIVLCFSVLILILSRLFPKPINIGVVLFSLSMLGGIFFSIYNLRILYGYSRKLKFGWESIWHSLLVGTIFIAITIGFWNNKQSKTKK